MAAKLSGTPEWDSLAPGTVGHLSEEQESQVKAFLERVPAEEMEAMRFPLEPPQFFACRLLRSRRFDVDAALKKVAETFVWRKAQKVRELAARDPAAILAGVAPDEIQLVHPKAYLPHPDKQGRPIYIERTGVVDTEVLMTLTDADHLEEHHIHCLETDVRDLYTHATRNKQAKIKATAAAAAGGGGAAAATAAGGDATTSGSAAAVEGGAVGGAGTAAGGAAAVPTRAAAAHAAGSALPPVTPEELAALDPLAVTTTLVSILDMEHMSMALASKASRDYVARMSKIDSSHYPETMAKMFIINAPGIFTVAWSMIKGFLDERTVRKIEILGGPATWKPRFEEYFDMETFPVEYGGKLTIPGGLFRPSRTVKHHLPSSKLFTYTVPAKAGQTLRFKWLCTPGDIRFSVDFYAGAAPKAAAESPLGHVSTCMSAADAAKAPGVVGVKPHHTPYTLRDHPGSDKVWVTATDTAPVDGYYVATFDNSAGWRARDVYCRWDTMVDGMPATHFSYNLALHA